MQLFSRNTAIVALSLGALALGACGEDVTVPVPTVSPITLSITPPSASMNVGEAVNFAVQISGGPSTGGPTLASCTSSSATVVTAAVSGSSCRVTAVAAGNATVTAAASTGQSASAFVSVAAPAAAISGLVVSPSAANVPVGQAVTIVPTVNRGSAAVTVAYTYATSNVAVATVSAAGVVTASAPGITTISVTATGTGAGFTTATLTSAAAITVTALPSGLTALNVTPSSLSLAIGSTAQIGATSTQPTGASAATYTYTSGNSAFASVSATGLVSAVAPGTTIITVTATSAANANFGSATLQSAVAVTVSPRAQIALTYINTPAGAAVDITNVAGQIQVGLNMITNGQIVTSAQVFACPTSATTCPAIGQAPAAQQTFGDGGGSTGAFQLSINTADFSVASDWSAATASYVNGQTTLVATITVAAATGSTANSNLAILNLNNVDGFAARHVAPATSVVVGGSAFFGGPTARGTVSIAPVIYSAGRTINSASVTVAGCAATYNFVTGTDARPWTMTYGAGTSVGTSRSCAYETLLAGAPDVFPTVTASVDNNNLGGPTAVAIANFLQTTTSSPAVTRPGAIRVDFVAPQGVTYTVAAGTNGSTGWVNDVYNFATNTGNIAATDIGTGLNTAAYKYEYTGCPIATTNPVYTTMTTNTGADIAECAIDFTANPYKVRFTAADKIGNLSAAVTSAVFGVDKTAPTVRYAASTDTNMTIYSVAPTSGSTADTLFSAEAIDERSGLNLVSYSAATAARATALGSCITGYATTTPATTNPGSTFITAPNCVYLATGVSLAGVLGDGYRPIVTPRQTYTSIAADGYATYSVRTVDRAGNSTTTLPRYVLINATTPTVTVTQPLVSPITSTFAGTFAGTFAELVEMQFTAFRAIYTGGDTLQFPAAATGVLAFDNLISTATAVTGGFPFTTGTTFYTNIETVASDNSFTGTTNAAADSVGLFVRNFGGFGAEQYKSTVINAVASVTPDAIAWINKTAGAGVTSFLVGQTTAGFNAPAGGLKVQVNSATTVINSPMSRVDFYRQVSAGRSEYLGSIDATVTPCTSASLACNVYVSDNGTTRTWTYVLRTTGASSTGSANAATVLTTGTFRALGTTGTAGRAISTQTRALTLGL